MTRPPTTGELFRKEFVFESLHDFIVTAMVAKFGPAGWKELSFACSMYLCRNADQIMNTLLHYPPSEDMDFIQRFGSNVSDFLIDAQELET